MGVAPEEPSNDAGARGEIRELRNSEHRFRRFSSPCDLDGVDCAQDSARSPGAPAGVDFRTAMGELYPRLGIKRFRAIVSHHHFRLYLLGDLDNGFVDSSRLRTGPLSTYLALDVRSRNARHSHASRNSVHAAAILDFPDDRSVRYSAWDRAGFPNLQPALQ
jgi:hypothetical protein